MLAESFVTIRGRRLDLDDLVDKRLYDENYLQGLRERLLSAKPFQHCVEDGWFNPILLELVYEEFENKEDPAWRAFTDKYQDTRRWVVGSKLGPASQLYFSLVNSGWFARMLSYITNVDELVVDVQLYGGGLHETKPGGHFGIHRDFDRHIRTGLHNEMVMITYLNKHWQPEWNGALELWDPTASKKVTSVEPEFGRTILMLHGNSSFHGHPGALTPPEGVVRRSLATYYYSNRFAEADRKARKSSQFLFFSKLDRMVGIGRAVIPPGLRKVLSRALKRDK